VLHAKDGPATHVVLANAAAALFAAGRIAEPRAGVALAREALQTGRALQVLEELRKLNHPSPAEDPP
jgi:anthranilate phosphoribosyltransferase